jgi:type II secretion system protein H
MRTGRPGRKDSGRQSAFTLIELILVIALVCIAVSLAAPSLSHFFQGRALNSEARQLLALTHAGQSRAVSSGFPMLLWIDSPGRAYGLVEESSAPKTAGQGGDPQAQDFALGDRLQIEAMNASPLPVNGRSLPAIRFLPDGTIDESSAAILRLTLEGNGTLWLIQATNRLSYEIRDSDK